MAKGAAAAAASAAAAAVHIGEQGARL